MAGNAGSIESIDRATREVINANIEINSTGPNIALLEGVLGEPFIDAVLPNFLLIASLQPRVRDSAEMKLREIVVYQQLK
jgi:hypothetical protein